jgi:hypothetical protein
MNSNINVNEPKKSKVPKGSIIKCMDALKDIEGIQNPQEAVVIMYDFNCGTAATHILTTARKVYKCMYDDVTEPRHAPKGIDPYNLIRFMIRSGETNNIDRCASEPVILSEVQMQMVECQRLIVENDKKHEIEIKEIIKRLTELENFKNKIFK